MVELTEEEKEKAKVLAEAWTWKWVESMQKKGKKLTKEGIAKYKKAMEAIAKVKILTEKSKKAS